MRLLFNDMTTNTLQKINEVEDEWQERSHKRYTQFTAKVQVRGYKCLNSDNSNGQENQSVIRR